MTARGQVALAIAFDLAILVTMLGLALLHATGGLS